MKWKCFATGILFFVFCLTSVSAKEESSWVFFDQYFDGSYVVYTYYDESTGLEGKERLEMWFKVPESALETVANSEDKLLEAKKQIFAAYHIFELEHKLKALNNIDLFFHSDKGLKIDPSIKSDFEFEMSQAFEYAEQAKKEWDQLPPFEKRGIYHEELDQLFDYEPFEQANDSENVDHDETTIPEDSEEKSNIHLWIIFSGVVGFLAIAIVFILNKKGV